MSFVRVRSVSASSGSSPYAAAAIVASRDGRGAQSVVQDDRPLILVVCNDAERLTSTRLALREAGLLSAAGRSVAAALSLLTQIVMDGCIVCQELTPEEANELRSALERQRPEMPRVYGGIHCEGIDGWSACAVEDVIPALKALLPTAADV